MKFDIPGRAAPAKVVLYRDGRERVYPLPFEATDPVDIEILAAEGLQVVPEPEPELAPLPLCASLEAPKPRTSRKEV